MISVSGANAGHLLLYGRPSHYRGEKYSPALNRWPRRIVWCLPLGSPENEASTFSLNPVGSPFRGWYAGNTFEKVITLAITLLLEDPPFYIPCALQFCIVPERRALHFCLLRLKMCSC